ncbi:MAG: HAD family hydrolase [Clostridia bacterium]
MIKNIIFDLGNVIVQNPSIDLVKEFFIEEKDAITFNEYIFKSDFWKMLDLGKMDNIEVANIIREQKLVNVKNFDEVTNFMLNWFSKCNVNIETMKIGEILKQNGYKIYILSNMAKRTYAYFLSRYDFFNMADGTIISAYEGIKKPNLKIFERLLKKYSLIAQESLLIDDDDTNKTLEVANAIGIKGRRVNANDFKDVKKLLIENGIDI